MTRKSLVIVFVACLVSASFVGPAAAGLTDTTNTQVADPPQGMVGIPEGNFADLRSDHVQSSSNISVDDLGGAVYASKHAESTELSIVTPEQATTVASGASPSEAAKEAVCSSPAAGKNPNFDCETPDDYALVLTDDQYTEGREVALRAPVVEETLGYLPERITVANNETGETWTSPASVEDGWLTADVEHFSSNAVTFSGRVEVDMTATAGSTSTYNISELDSVENYTAVFEGVESTHWDNETATALADAETFAVDVAGNLAPSGPSGNGEPVVTFTGRQSTGSTYTESGTGDGSFTIAGDTAPSGPENGEPRLVLEGRESTGSQTTASGGDGDTVDPSGNVAPVGPSASNEPEITFIGKQTTGDRYTPSGTGDTSLTINGDDAPTGPSADGEPEITFTGRSTTTWDNRTFSAVGTESISYPVDGNLEPRGPDNGEPTVTLTGVAGDDTPDIFYIGNGAPKFVDATGDTGSLPGEGSEYAGAAGDFDGDGAHEAVYADNYDSYRIEMVDKSGGEVGLTSQTGIGMGGAGDIDGDGDTDFPFIQNSDNLADDGNLKFVDTSGNVVDTGKQATNVGGVADVDGDGTQEIVYRDATYDYLKTVESDGTTNTIVGSTISGVGGVADVDGDGTLEIAYTANDGGAETVRFAEPDGTTTDSGAKVTDSSFGGVSIWMGGVYDSDGDGDKEVAVKKGGGGVSNADGLVLVDQSGSMQDTGKTADNVGFIGDFELTEDPSVDVDGDGTAEASTSGVLLPGDEVTRTVSSLSTSDDSWSVDTSGVVDVAGHVEEIYATEDQSVDVDGDGSADASVSGVLAAGETATVELAALPHGSTTIDSTVAAGPHADWTITYDEELHTNAATADIDGDGTAEASVSGELADGETATVELAALDESAQTVDLAVSSGALPSWDVTYTPRTATEGVTVDVDGDGSADASQAGVLQSGETATLQLANLTDGGVTFDSSVVAGPQPNWTVTYDEELYSHQPAIDIDGDGTDEVSHGSILAPGETATYELSGLTLGDRDATIDVPTGVVDASVKFKEHVETNAAVLSVNGNDTQPTGRLSAGETDSIAANESWIQTGENTVTVQLPDQNPDAPVMQVGLDYDHRASITESVVYEATAWSEQYNVSKTYGGDRTQASLTIPFEGTVLNIESLEYRFDNGTWTQADSSEYSLQETTLTADIDAMYGGEIPENTTVGVRTTGRKVQVSGGTIQVTEPTALTDDRLDSRLEVTESTSDQTLTIKTGSTRFGSRIHYVYNQSWVEHSDHTEITQDTQRLVVPNAETADTMRISTIPVTAQPETADGDVTVTVDDPRTTEPVFEVSSGSSEGDEITFTYLNAQDDTEYVLYSETDGVVLDSGTASSPLSLEGRDDAGVLQFQLSDSGSSSGDGDGSTGVLGPIDSPSAAETVLNVDLSNIWVVLLVVGGVTLVGVVYWRDGEDGVVEAGRGTASGLRGAAAWTAGSLRDAATWTAGNLSSASTWFATHPYITAGLVGAGSIAAVVTGVITLPEGAGVFALVVGTPAVAYVVLVQRLGASRLVWAAITGVAVILGFQLLGTDVFGVLAASQAFPILAAGSVYLAYKALEAYRADATTPEEQNVIEFNASDDEDDDNGGGRL